MYKGRGSCLRDVGRLISIKALQLSTYRILRILDSVKCSWVLQACRKVVYRYHLQVEARAKTQSCAQALVMREIICVPYLSINSGLILLWWVRSTMPMKRREIHTGDKAGNRPWAWRCRGRPKVAIWLNACELRCWSGGAILRNASFSSGSFVSSEGKLIGSSSLVSRSSSSINDIQFFPAVLPVSSLPGLARFSYWS